MYTAFFSLNEVPFSIAPNPKFLFMSDRHREALSHLTYGLGDTGGFVLLTGEVGTGKTTISRCLMEQLPDNIQIAFILNPTLSSQELLATICDELKIKYRKTGATLKTLTDKIQEKLLKNHADNINTLLIVDEAQHLQPEVLEQLRLLTNLETHTKKLLQVILIGQPELQLLLKRRDLRQLAQRITARYHLLPLNKQEVAQYIKHRLSIAECHRALFNDGAISTIHKLSQGIPRLINLLCDKALMQAYNTNNAVVDKKCVITASKEALGDDFDVEPWWQNSHVKIAALALSFSAVFLIGIFAAGTFWQQVSPNKDEQVVVNSAVDATTAVASNSETSMPASPVADALDIADGVEVTPNTKQTVDQPVTEIAKTARQPDERALSEPLKKAPESPQVSVKTEPEKVENVVEKPLVVSSEKKPTQTKKPAMTFDSVEGVSDELLAKFKTALNDIDTNDYPNPVKRRVSEDKIPPLTDMPNWVQNDVPKLNFDMHIYASDGEGWVRVNGRDRYEGDTISDDLLLEQILPQTVILNYQGHRFSLPALSSW